MSDPQTGPQIEGLTYIEHLGTGGYSDVYLYEQRRPRMRVAVKVLNDARLSAYELAQFATEAETMAELADHPFIVQVFSTGSTQDGRPYLVMKYYPPPNLGRRVATQRMTVADVLRTGIQIASAVETAHRVGILHRDIKPANILISQYGEPGLADFGIAGKATDSEDDDDLGVSIPWSPPEILSGASNGSIASDVYSLAATIWHLLAGRSPHEVPGGDNTPRALMGRILRSAPPGTGRADAPASLDRLLQQSMSKNPQLRPASALEFARLLQGIEQDLRYARTQIVVIDESGSTAAPAEDESPPRPAAGAAPLGPRYSRTDRPDEPATTQRPVRASTAQEPPAQLPPRKSRQPAAARAVEAPEAPTSRRPARPTEEPGSPTPANRFAPPDVAGAAAGGVSGHAPAQALQEEGTRARPVVPDHQLGSLPGGRTSVDPPPTTRRPAGPRTEPVPAPARPRRMSRLTLVLFAAASCVVAVLAGVVLLSGSHGGNKPGGGDSPSGPVGRDQAGFQSPAIKAPKITATYDAAAQSLTFSWSAAASSVHAFVYSLNGNPLVGPTSRTSLSVKTTSPSNTCLVVGAIAADGTRQLTAPVCG